MVQFHDRVWGPDVSSWQGDVDWMAVKDDGAAFAITKATEGVSYVNPFANATWAGMRTAGLIRVQYHYARPVINLAAKEADYFLEHMLALSPGDIVALDLETDQRDGPFADGVAYWALEWLTSVQASVGFAPMLYCNGGILSDPSSKFAELPEMGKRNGLWLASWGEVFPKAYAPWGAVALWQFTNSGRVPGIAGLVDLNIFNGDAQTMMKYGKPEGKSNGDMFAGWDEAEFRHRIAGLISAVGYMGGDLADALDSLTISKIKSVQEELRRVKKEQVG
jgi:lysozyme